MLLDVERLEGFPTTRAEQEAWLIARQEHVAQLTRTSLRKIVTTAYKRFVGSLTASGDLGELDSIPTAWLDVVHSTLVPELGETYLAGSVTAWVGMPEATIDAAFAKQWTGVVNHNAESYMDDATNRLAGVGQSTWQAVRDETSQAISSGASNEDLKGRIEAVTQFSEFRADTIARTETVGAYVQGDMGGARALGDLGPVYKVWVAALDDRTRDDHEDAHEQVRLLDEPFDVGGDAMDAPHDPSADAGQVVNCRCYVEFLYEGDELPDGTIAAWPDDAVPDQLSIDDDAIAQGTELVDQTAELVEPAGAVERVDFTNEEAARSYARDTWVMSDLPGGASTTLNDVRMLPDGLVRAGGKIMDADLYPIGEWQRTLDTVNNRVTHNMLDLSKSAQGKGLASAFNARAEASYVAQGFTHIDLHASLSVGGYSWARAGYMLDVVEHAKDVSKLTKRLREFAKAGKLTEAFAAQAAPLIEAGDMPALARLGEQAKTLLLRSDWHGTKAIGGAG